MYMNVFFKPWLNVTLISVFVLLAPGRISAAGKASGPAVLHSKTYRHYIEQFNKRDGDKDPDHAAFPNSQA
ncbi:MAG: hypothetical protein ACYS32_03690, partial [Planctomycetota bacterium]